uniref:Uncharacterized protein n=1 Tax=Anguilla anguilla TaxID=7936 RepID=A0A0E9PY18_ANGAN
MKSPYSSKSRGMRNHWRRWTIKARF